MDGTTIELNGERRSIKSGATVRELLEVELRIAGERVAVELEIVTFVGGG